ncbi:pectinesterase family protein [Niabella yanshanensis]|uniref:Pectinesterase family protein n=1 Tax=Niabella yanshanensis TaxID=577386 RepID=A0ABZ0VZD9_9BACT|nr:pectinesterase family protein [Niabella yanshanensis]WQD36395.1 pectinesterase family protein [Niabella yanshanensis]
MVYKAGSGLLGLVAVYILLMCSCSKKESPVTKDGLEFPTPGEVHAEAQSTSVKLSWLEVAGAYGYLVEIAKGTTFTNPFYKSDTLFVTQTEVTGLEALSNYTIRLKALHKDNPSITSKGLLQQFTTVAPPIIEKVPDVVVAKDGSGNYTKVQAAIDAAPTNRTSYYYIYVKKGEYKEVISINQDKPYIYLVGEDSAQTILTYDNHSGKPKPGGGTFGTADSRSFYVKGNHFVADNITFANTAGMNAGQAVAIYIDAVASAFINCRFLGYQDTWYAHNATHQYIKNCYIEGSVDFMFGGAKTLFDNCQIHSNRTGGYVTAASTPTGQDYGYVYLNCNFTANAGVSAVYLGRPWRPEAQVVLMACQLGSHIRAEGWHNWNNPDNEKTAYYAEYKSTGPGANAIGRVSWSHQLPDTEASKYTFEKMFGNWDPGFLAGNVRIVVK